MISLAFSSIKERNFEKVRKKLCATIQMLHQKYQFLLEGEILIVQEQADLKKVILLLDEYADCFGNVKDIYNPWFILNYLDTKTAAPYWVNTSSNQLISKLLQEGNKEVKESFEKLLRRKVIYTEIYEQIIYERLDIDENAIWSLMLASGYLKVSDSRTVETSNEWAHV